MPSGRWGNVTGALLGDVGSGGFGREEDDRLALLAEGLDGIFEEMFVIGREFAQSVPGRHIALSEGEVGVLAGVVAALEASSMERVIVVAPTPTGPALELVLALMAWPQASAVVAAPTEGEESLCAIYERAAVLSTAGALNEKHEASLADLHEAVAARSVSLEALGLSDLRLGEAAVSFSLDETSASEAR